MEFCMAAIYRDTYAGLVILKHCAETIPEPDQWKLGRRVTN